MKLMPTPSPLLACLILFSLPMSSLPAASADSDSPRGIIQKDDLKRARTHLKQSDWARKYLNDLKTEVDPWQGKFSPEFLANFIPEHTPGEQFFTACPSCRDKGKPYLVHGDWEWLPERPEVLVCKVCRENYPSEDYPETISFSTTWGKPQTFTFAGGEPFLIYYSAEGRPTRPSFTGNIRAQKVAWISGLSRKMAEVYALTEEVSYAENVRGVLLRLAETYPYWLLHSGYGCYADMDPKEAARNINSLPKDEKVYPPNRPARSLYSGYWSAGRARGVGIEGLFVIDVTTAYDLTRGAKRADGTPVYSEEEKRKVETDLLLESTVLLVADKVVNNASMANRSAAGLVGIVLKDPELVRFGIQGFEKTVTEWFLADGGTPESPSYSIMALGGIVEFTQALRNYSDPKGYVDSNGKRYDNYNPYHDERYYKIWEGIPLSLQGDLFYPPFADTYPKSEHSAWFAELMASNYPDNDQYLALLYEKLGRDWNAVHAPSALYYSDADRALREVPTLHLQDHLFPVLKVGFMRSGSDGRESLLLLSASDWGFHHHHDSLNLYYWKSGNELWSDLGYLWDHMDYQMTARTLAHNTVLINGQNQITDGRVGKVHYFVSTDHVKGMRASSNAYPSAKIYERASTLVDHGSGNSYVVDVFWAQGGNTQDYVYHGPHNDWKAIHADESPLDLKESKESQYDFVNIRQTQGKEIALEGFAWNFPNNRVFTVWHLPQAGERTFVGDGWGQRSSRNLDRGETLPYIVRQTKGARLSTFVSVLEEHYAGAPFVRKITKLVPGGDASTVTALQIDTPEGRDYIVANQNAGKVVVNTPDGRLETDASLAVISVNGGETRFSAVDEGKVELSLKR